ncbi:MAG: hypothetical protein ACHQFX_17745 [Chitinophagales bacterium]
MDIQSIAIIVVGGWLVINGILHDVFVLSQHGKVYDRNLLRLLMDGHILIFSGVILLFCYNGIQHKQPWALYTAIVVCVSMLLYCAMIFPFLKSIATILLNVVLLILLLIKLPGF